MDIRDLYEFMKENFVIRAKYEDIELELHPLAFSKHLEEAPMEVKEEPNYDEFIFPSKEQLQAQGL